MIEVIQPIFHYLSLDIFINHKSLNIGEVEDGS